MAQSTEARQARDHHLCPFVGGACQKFKEAKPGVCSSLDVRGRAFITCPVRFREGGLIYQEAKDFFFPGAEDWSQSPEIRLRNSDGDIVGNFDNVVVQLDGNQVVEWGALEVQGVYISGNVGKPFRHFMEDPDNRGEMDWSEKHPTADWLSSQKRLFSQLREKGLILERWQKKMAVAVQVSFFDTFPPLPEVPQEQADICWMLYDLERGPEQRQLCHVRNVYTKWGPTLAALQAPEPEEQAEFERRLQAKFE